MAIINEPRREPETDPPSLPLSASPLISGWQPPELRDQKRLLFKPQSEQRHQPHLCRTSIFHGPGGRTQNVPSHSSKMGLAFHFPPSREKTFHTKFFQQSNLKAAEKPGSVFWDREE